MKFPKHKMDKLQKYWLRKFQPPERVRICSIWKYSSFTVVIDDTLSMRMQRRWITQHEIKRGKAEQVMIEFVKNWNHRVPEAHIRILE